MELSERLKMIWFRHKVRQKLKGKDVELLTHEDILELEAIHNHLKITDTLPAKEISTNKKEADLLTKLMAHKHTTKYKAPKHERFKKERKKIILPKFSLPRPKRIKLKPHRLGRSPSRRYGKPAGMLIAALLVITVAVFLIHSGVLFTNNTQTSGGSVHNFPTAPSNNSFVVVTSVSTNVNVSSSSSSYLTAYPAPQYFNVTPGSVQSLSISMYTPSSGTNSSSGSTSQSYTISNVSAGNGFTIVNSSPAFPFTVGQNSVTLTIEIRTPSTPYYGPLPITIEAK